ncbi:MAG: hypothetical protein F6K31_10680 [Symploca sp. SIO2G7]|nr:hypothetical protein [Symploca sp. SIO2G7]
MSLVICHWSFVIGHLSLVICHWSFVIGHLSFVICYWSIAVHKAPGRVYLNYRFYCQVSGEPAPTK